METEWVAMMLHIIPFERRYASHFRDLNLAWVEKYFYVEEKDHIILNDCENQIIKSGGAIFFGRLGEEVVACYALIRLAQDTLELGKMAVDPRFQGRQFGHALLKHAIAYARAGNWRKIILYSNKKLGPALHLYKKFGFREVPLEPNVPYVRSDIKMELSLEQTIHL